MVYASVTAPVHARARVQQLVRNVLLAQEDSLVCLRPMQTAALNASALEDPGTASSHLTHGLR